MTAHADPVAYMLEGDALVSHSPASTAAQLVYRAQTYSQFADFTLDAYQDLGQTQSHAKLPKFCDDGSLLTQGQDNDNDDRDDDGATTGSDVLGDPEGNARDKQSTEACVENRSARKRIRTSDMFQIAMALYFPRLVSRYVALELFGQHRDLEALLADKQLPVPQTVFDLCQGSMSKYIALAYFLTECFPVEQDVGMDVAPVQVQSHV